MPFLASFGGGSARGFNPGGSGFDWGQFSTGDVYQGGYMRVINSTTLQWWFYPTQRTNGQTQQGSTITSTVTLEGAADIKCHVFGGGGGGSGTNGSGGGGGGFASTTSAATLGSGQLISFGAGSAGLGGVAQNVDGLNNVNYLGDSTGNPNNKNTDGGTSYISFGVGGSSLYLQALGGTGKQVVNPSSYSDCGQGGTGTVISNTLGLTTLVGSGGDGGSRNLSGVSAVGGGGGGGNNNASGGLDKGGNSTKAGGGGGGSGNGQTPSSSQNGGGAGGTYGFTGGLGGDTDTNIFGYQGTDLYTDVSNTLPIGAGYAYQNSDNTGWGLGTILGRGSAGGGGFPGGGGGSSYYGGGISNFGVGGDGASGAVMLEISF
ncbi:hypothetical protein CRP3_gp29 [Roseobacter phage CRP-3]|nr:hypothetical protein CRP3_gp29 [Roseobacter phage CRP-3]